MKFILALSNGTKYIVEEETLDAFYSLLDGSEEFVSKWHRGENGEDHFYTHHVFSPENSMGQRTHEVETIPNGLYALAKLAGKPQ